MLSYNPPNCVSFDSKFVFLRSVELIPRKLKIPIDCIEKAKLIRKRIDSDGDETVLRLIFKNNYNIDDLKLGFKSVAYFGFIYGNCFDCLIFRSDKIISDIVNSINEKVKLANQ